MPRLASKVALITGAASGIGRASAMLFAREGAHVVVADVQNAAAEATVAAIVDGGGEALFLHADVSRTADAQAMIDATIRRFGRLTARDVVVQDGRVGAAGTDGVDADVVAGQVFGE